MLETIKSIFLNDNFISAILIALFFIILGFFLIHKKVITKDGKNALTFIVLKIALPAMAFTAFMADFSKDDFVENIKLFILSLLLYIFFMYLSQLLFLKYGKEKRKVYAIFVSLGQLTFFCIPVLKTIYKANISEFMIPANMVTLSFRIMLYTYTFFTISKMKFTKEQFSKSIREICFNPVMIAMILGLLIWVTQPWLPKIDGYSFLRIDKTIPSVYKLLDTIDSLTTPLALTVIGCILGESSFKEAIEDKLAWFISICRAFIVPVVIIGIVILLQFLKIMKFDEYSFMVLIIGFASPLSAVASTYCSKYFNEEMIASRVCLLSTILALVCFPILFVLVKLCLTLPMF